MKPQLLVIVLMILIALLLYLKVRKSKEHNPVH